MKQITRLTFLGLILFSCAQEGPEPVDPNLKFELDSVVMRMELPKLNFKIHFEKPNGVNRIALIDYWSLGTGFFRYEQRYFYYSSKDKIPYKVELYVTTDTGGPEIIREILVQSSSTRRGLKVSRIEDISFITGPQPLISSMIHYLEYGPNSDLESWDVFAKNGSNGDEFQICENHFQIESDNLDEVQLWEDPIALLYMGSTAIPNSFDPQWQRTTSYDFDNSKNVLFGHFIWNHSLFYFPHDFEIFENSYFNECNLSYSHLVDDNGNSFSMDSIVIESEENGRPISIARRDRKYHFYYKK